MSKGVAPTTSLMQAQDWLREQVDEGIHCPLCLQYAKVYKRAINSGMARALIVMYREGGRDWLHKPTVLRGLGAAARDESLLRYWDLVQPDPDRYGWWRVTPRGAAFVYGTVRVPKYARVYDGRCLGLTGPLIDIHEALGNQFSLSKLMAGE
jgi:hypothetical protein